MKDRQEGGAASPFKNASLDHSYNMEVDSIILNKFSVTF